MNLFGLYTRALLFPRLGVQQSENPGVARGMRSIFAFILSARPHGICPWAQFRLQGSALTFCLLSVILLWGTRLTKLSKSCSSADAHET